MNRVQLFKCMRRQTRRVIFTFLISIIIVAFGVYMVDYTVNSMMGFETKHRIISITNKEVGIYEICFMNQVNELNLTYIIHDINKLKIYAEESYRICYQYINELSNQIQSVINLDSF